MSATEDYLDGYTDGVMGIKAKWLRYLENPAKMNKRQAERFFDAAKNQESSLPSSFSAFMNEADPGQTGSLTWKQCSAVLKKYLPHLFEKDHESGDEGKAEELIKRTTRSMGSAYSAKTHLFHACAVGDLAMCKVLIGKFQVDPQISTGKKSSRFKDSDTPLALAKRYDNKMVRKYLKKEFKSKEKEQGKEKESQKNTLSTAEKMRRMGGSMSVDPSVISESGVDFSYLIESNEIRWGENGRQPVGEQGGTATVFRATYVGTPCAVKVLKRSLNDTAMETFTKEISVMSKLHHPRIVLLMGACINDPQNLMIVMELMEGGSVWSQLRKKTLPPLRQRMNWAYQTCLGMSYLHRPDNKILHLDLKSANLLLDSSLSVKVADFGLSEVKKLQAVPIAVSEGDKKNSDDGPMLIEGSIPWMAPECFRSEEYTEKADVYSFGVILWELVTAQVPWSDLSHWSITYQVGMAGKRLAIPDNVPKTAKKMMQSCFENDPAARPSFSDLLQISKKLPVEVAVADATGCDFWLKHFFEQVEVDWKEFFQKFLSYCGLIGERESYSAWADAHFDLSLALKAALAWSPETMKQISEGNFFTAPARVRIDQFGTFLTFFGPFSRSEGRKFLERVFSVLKQKFFHGDIDTPEAIRRLSHQPEGTYLVRFSTRSPGTYTLSVRSSLTEISHYRLPGVGGEACDSMESFVASTKNLTGACKGSKYQPIFSAYAYKEIQSAYLPNL
mmetsp:Transcript_24577/g.38321  ORF Transcript_24577/g.38321 Transcript_24577/m.38321 type:complete len:730 (-) Transcript_24577:176-2365(-)|eukprot:CAMPEP_0201508464 /NCGR_PEP_ID=MMETSP0161_2-20130828/1828_1 /ASSEMBLY_ACC=CAM_ASM_000251 /TAXON_ID=180227 /ORGANISM="Neoparamoeba aestuarina, Strain SoJaBio B1-5/56/2" /LENGTH=729 /DNA_ID=CAMNT_0047903143 /DNA_START=194 /DNA_END=2383 /DNA_ORIENTATION=-